MDSACGEGWHVCTDTEWYATYTPGQFPGGQLSSWGEPQSNRCGGGVWQAMQPESSGTWDSGVCESSYNPWNSGKYLYSESGQILQGDGGWGNWDNSFAGTGSSSGFAVYCCAGASAGPAPVCEQDCTGT